MLINYEYYRVFYYVAKYRSFTQAANVLLSSQPNITRTIRNLENALDCKLFVRSNRGVALTPEGERLLTYVQVAHERLQAGEAELSREKGLQSGVVSVGVSETALHELLLPTLNSFHKAYPGVKLRISSHSTPQAIAVLQNALVDFAVVISPTTQQRSLREQRLKPYRELAVCGPALAHLCDTELSLKDFPQYPFICLGSETITYTYYSGVFAAHGVPFTPEIEAASIEQVLPMVKNNLGIGFLPEKFARPALQSGEIYELKLKEHIPSRYICLLERTDRGLSIAAEKLKQLLLAACEL